MIFLFQKFIPHYRIPVFEQLDNELNGNLVVCYGQPFKYSYFRGLSDSFSFKTVKFTNYWLGAQKGDGTTALWQDFWKVFQRFGKPEIVIIEFNFRILYLLPLYYYCKAKKIPFVLWGHGGSRKRSIKKSKSLKDKLYRWLMNKSNAIIVYDKQGYKQLISFLPLEKVFIAQNTLDIQHLLKLRSQLEKQGQKSVKLTLNLNLENYFCYIGRLTPEKSLEKLIDIYETAIIHYPNTGLIIIGDGIKKNSLEKYVNEKQLNNVIFMGTITNWEESTKYLFCSDLILIPGAVGLSVNHSFAFGLPVITTKATEDGPYHGPEIEYVIDGITGFKCDDNDIDDFTNSIGIVLKNKSYYKTQTIKFCSDNLLLEKMISGIKDAIQFAKNN